MAADVSAVSTGADGGVLVGVMGTVAAPAISVARRGVCKAHNGSGKGRKEHAVFDHCEGRAVGLCVDARGDRLQVTGLGLPEQAGWLGKFYVVKALSSREDDWHSQQDI